MTTFRDNYCAAGHCRNAEFDHRLFWHCLHRRAVLLAPLLTAVDAEYFAADRELIARVGRVRTMPELHEEIREYRNDLRNQQWLRKRGDVRVSTRRLLGLARRFLAGFPLPR